MQNMYAYVTRQGTAMAETALCPRHTDPESVQKSADQATLAADWDTAEPLHDCGDNPELECIICGASVT